MGVFRWLLSDIAVAEFDRSCMCALGHDVFKILIECGNGIRQQCVGLVDGGGVYNTFYGQS